MVKNYIALDGFTGTDVSVYKHQVIKMDEGKAAQLVADGKLAEYYNSCAIPKYDLSAMGASVGETVDADTKALYNDLTSGITKCTMDFNGMHFEWNVLGIKVTEESTSEAVEFSGVFIFNDAPALVLVEVHNGASGSGGEIKVSLVLLAKAAA
jgi:hypothetical protein